MPELTLPMNDLPSKEIPKLIEDAISFVLSAEDPIAAANQFAEERIPLVLELVSDTAEKLGVEEVATYTWFGGPSVGKGNSLYYFAQTLERQDISTELRSFLRESIPANYEQHTLTTGNRGIFRPMEGDPRYSIYEPLVPVAKKFAELGKLAPDSWVNLLVLCEFSRIIEHIGSHTEDDGYPVAINFDFWPRSEGQSEFFRDEIIPTLVQKGLRIKHSNIVLEPVDKATADLMSEHPEETIKQYKRVGEELLRILEEHPEYKDVSIFSSDALDINDIPAGYYKVLDKLMETFAETRENIAATSLGSNETIIANGLIAGLEILAVRILDRVPRYHPKVRYDDHNLGTIIQRIAEYYEKTAPAAFMFGDNVVAVGEEGGRYDLVTTVILEHMARTLGIDPNSIPDWNTFVKAAEDWNVEFVLPKDRRDFLKQEQRKRFFPN